MENFVTYLSTVAGDSTTFVCRGMQFVESRNRNEIEFDYNYETANPRGVKTTVVAHLNQFTNVFPIVEWNSPRKGKLLMYF